MVQSLFRKTAALCLCALLLTGCAPAARAQETHIVFWHCMSERNGDALTALVDDYNQGAGRQDGVIVQAVYQGSYTDATTKMKTLLAAGAADDLPDVMTMDATGKTAYLAAGIAYTADEAAGEDECFVLGGFLRAPLANWRVADAQLGVPFAASTTVMYYNKTRLDGAGLSAPDTLADIAAMAGRVTDADGRAVTVYAAIPNTPSLANWLAQMNCDLVNRLNGSEGTATALDCVENGELEAFLDIWQALYESGALLNRQGGSDLFVSGETLLYTASSSSLGSLLQKTEGAFELGVAPFPRVNAQSEGGAAVGGSCLVMFDHGDARRGAARAFVRHMTSDVPQARFAAQTGYVPVTESALRSDEYVRLIEHTPQYQVAAAQLMNTKEHMRAATIGPAVDFYYAVEDGVSRMLTDGETPAEAAQALEEELNGLLAQYLRANPE